MPLTVARKGVWDGRLGWRTAMVGGHSHGPELVLNHPDGDLAALRPHNPALHHELHGGYVMQKHRPGNGQLHVQSHGQCPARFKPDAAAREIEGAALPRIQNPFPVDQFPPQVQQDRIAPVDAPVPRYAFRCSAFLVPSAAASHNLSRLSPRRVHYACALAEVTVMPVLERYLRAFTPPDGTPARCGP